MGKMALLFWISPWNQYMYICMSHLTKRPKKCITYFRFSTRMVRCTPWSLLPLWTVPAHGQDILDIWQGLVLETGSCEYLSLWSPGMDCGIDGTLTIWTFICWIYIFKKYIKIHVYLPFPSFLRFWSFMRKDSTTNITLITVSSCHIKDYLMEMFLILISRLIHKLYFTHNSNFLPVSEINPRAISA